jgi:hypothetical protein
MAARVGDIVEVPGGMSGTVKFIGAVDGKNGTFAGVQLSNPYAARGKNSGEVEGRYYFRTTIPGSGIFLPVEKAVKKGGPATPKAGGLSNFNQGGRTPMASLPKPNFSQSIGPGARAASPALRPIGRRESLPRPSSPLRKVQTPAVNKLATPKTRPSIGLAKSTIGNGPQYRGSPSLSMKKNQFSQSLRQSSITPAKKSLSPLGPEASYEEEADSTPTPTPFPVRTIDSAIQDEEVKRLKTSLEQRDTQLKEQAASIAEMERSLEQLQALIPDSDVERPPSYTSEAAPSRSGGGTSQEVAELREALREKNDKIKMLTAEFDANRADFRSTIDTLEMASTETERVYEKRVDELLEELRHLQDSREDVEGVAQQFKQLEELVQELEEGLEEARRGEAEARGEVEFLRGEVERTRSGLRREKEKKRTERALNGDPLDLDDDDDRTELLHQVEQKDDEIHGLKAIINSLNGGSSIQINGHHVNGPNADTHLHAQIQSLEALLEQKSEREEELTRELSRVQSQSVTRFPPPPMHRSAGSKNSNRLSDRTVIPSVDSGQAWHDAQEDKMEGGVGMGDGNGNGTPGSPTRKLDRVHEHEDDSDADTDAESEHAVPESARSDASSGALWCEICETGGHDILTCKDMFGQNSDGNAHHQQQQRLEQQGGDEYRTSKRDSARPAPLVSRRSLGNESGNVDGNSNGGTSRAPQGHVNPMDMVGPVAGKTSGRVDEEKWCAFCERDGHESVDCPFEDAF